MSATVTFRLVKPVVVYTKEKSTTTVIPSGAVVELVHPAIGDLVQVHWDGKIHSVSLNELLSACK